DLSDDALGGGRLVAGMDRSQPPSGRDPGMGQQAPGTARVLGGDDVGRAQLLDRAGRQVTEVADGSADKDERPRRAVGHSFTSTVSPGFRPQRSHAPAWPSPATARFAS